jgi:hypothetical protein
MISALGKISFGASLLVLVAVSPARADTTPTFYKDQRAGCNVGTFAPEPGLSVRWSGPCQSGLAEGSGTVEWLKNGVSLGHSEGTYHSGLREGVFTLTDADGKKSVADYRNGQAAPIFVAVLACGSGPRAATGSAMVQWTGACVNGKGEGAGVATLQAGPDYWRRTEATFHAGLAEGRGVTQMSDGKRYEGELRDGKMNGRCVRTTPAVRIDTQCVDDKLNGSGVATFDDGSRYEGEFHDDHMSGRGVFTTSKGGRLEGDFTDGVLNGPGRAVNSLGDRYEGDFINGDKEGTGRYYFADGGVYEGEWTNNLPNGRGVFHGIPNGIFNMSRDFAGTWVNGCFSQPPLSAALFKKRAACGFDD